MTDNNESMSVAHDDPLAPDDPRPRYEIVVRHLNALKIEIEQSQSDVALYRDAHRLSVQRLLCAPMPEHPYEIAVKMMTSGSKALRVVVPDGTWTLLDVKVVIQLQHGIPVEQQRLIFMGKQLPDRKSLLDEVIPRLATLHLVLRLRGD